MYKVIDQYTSKLNLQANQDIFIPFDTFLKKQNNIKKYSISNSFNRYVLDIKLTKYSVDASEELFRKINSEISYSYSSIYVRYNEGKCVRYRYITSKENKDAIYCDIIFN